MTFRERETDHGDDPITLEEVRRSIRRQAVRVVIAAGVIVWDPDFTPPPADLPGIHPAVHRLIDASGP